MTARSALASVAPEVKSEMQPEKQPEKQPEMQPAAALSGELSGEQGNVDTIETLPETAGEVSQKIETPAEAEKPKHRGFTIGYAYGHHSYVEPGLMKESGHLNGLAFGLETRPLEQAMLLRLSGEYLFGGVTYEGSLYYANDKRTEPWTTNANDFIYTVKGILGFPFLNWGRGDLGLFAGLGTRYLYDQLQGRGSYEREISYFYLPAGLEMRFFLRAKSMLLVTAEYDRFISGTAKSHLTQTGRSRDISNTQNSGYGHRLAADLSFWLSDSMDLHIAPYWQHWQVDDSDRVAMDKELSYEPMNSTEQIGVTIAIGM
jgi:hypothetical protein